MADSYKRHSSVRRKTKRRRKRKRRGSILATVLCLFLVLVFLIGGTFFFFSKRMLDKIEKVDKSEEVWLSPEEAIQEIYESEEPIETDIDPEGEEIPREDTLAPEEVVWTAPIEAVKEPKVKNILLIGQDRRPGETRARSDVMILCSINEDIRITFSIVFHV